MHLGDSRDKYFEIGVILKWATINHNKQHKKYRYPAALVVNISENKLKLPPHDMA